jgi:hypothetical protein
MSVVATFYMKSQGTNDLKFIKQYQLVNFLFLRNLD